MEGAKIEGVDEVVGVVEVEARKGRGRKEEEEGKAGGRKEEWVGGLERE